MNYQQQIEEIVNSALTEKTFNLEIVNKIKELKDGFDEAQERIKVLEEEKTKYWDMYQKEQEKNEKLETKLEEFETRKSTLAEKEKKQEKLEYELSFQQQRANEIKELFGTVFRNPVVMKSKLVGHMITPNTPGAYPQSYTTNDSETEEIK